MPDVPPFEERDVGARRRDADHFTARVAHRFELREQQVAQTQIYGGEVSDLQGRGLKGGR